MKSIGFGLVLGLLALAGSHPVMAETGGHEHGHAHHHNAPQIEAMVASERDLIENRKVPVILKLQHKGSGFPVLTEELEVNHTEKVHLLIVDPSLTDYHHEHPLAMNNPGQYVFTLTARTSCDYRVWAEIDTINGPIQYAVTDIDNAGTCENKEIDRTVNSVYEGENYTVKMGMNTPRLRVGQDSIIEMTIRNKDGQYIDELEPVMGAFAHVVGFYDDYKTIAHMHPMGEPPVSHLDYGGPTLKFHIKPEKAGYLKLFAQFKVNNITVFAPFGVEVAEENETPSAYINRDAAFDKEWAEAIAKQQAEDEAALDEPAPVRKKTKSWVKTSEPKSSDGGLDDLYQENTDTSTDLYEDPEAKILGESGLEKPKSLDPNRLKVIDDPF